MNFIGTFKDYFISMHGNETFNEIKDMILSKRKNVQLDNIDISEFYAKRDGEFWHSFIFYYILFLIFLYLY